MKFNSVYLGRVIIFQFILVVKRNFFLFHIKKKKDISCSQVALHEVNMISSILGQMRIINLFKNVARMTNVGTHRIESKIIFQ
jgi:hypothetical protein